MTLRDVGRLFVDAGKKFLEDKATRLAAALAYYTALSLSPLLMLVITITGAIYGAEAARGEIQNQIRGTVGDQGAEAIETMLANTHTATGGTLATLLGVATLLIGATGVFAQIQDSLNSIWKLPPKPNPTSGILQMLRERLLSFSLICGMAFLLLVSLAVSAVVTSVGGVLSGWMPHWVSLMNVLNVVLSYLLTTALLALIFKILPELRMSWSDVWLGAAITGFFFLIGKSLISLYIGRSAVGSTYGAAGAFVVLLVWIYYSSLLLLYGAELTYLYAKNHGSGVAAQDGTPLKEVPSEAAIVHRVMQHAGTSPAM